MAKAIQQFNKANLQALRVEMDNALQAISNKYGITIKAGNASYSGNECTFKVKCNTKATDGTVITKEAMNWDRIAKLKGLGHLSVGSQVILQGKTFTIAGWNTRARKAPINIVNVHGDKYKCTPQMLLNAMIISE